MEAVVDGLHAQPRSNADRYSDDLAPSAESPAASSTVFGCGTAMTMTLMTLKVIEDVVVDGETTLRVAS